MSDEATNEAQPIIDIAVASTKPSELDGDRYSVIVPAGAEHLLVDLFDVRERQSYVPYRKRGLVTFYTPASLCAYTAAHSTGSATAIYADVEQSTVVAVFNGDTNDDAGWGDHRAVLTLRHPPAWKRWTSANNRMGNQQAFAEHIETGMGEIVEPPAADLLEMAQHFQATAKVEFKSAKVLTNGQRQLVYEETIDAKAGQKGQLSIPGEFVVALQPFEDSATYRVTARLRYRISDGSLVIGYALDRPEEVLRAAFDDVLTEIQDTTKIRPYLGKPLVR